MAYEFIAPPDGEDEGAMPQPTPATDVWAFAMTTLEVNQQYYDHVTKI